MDIGVHAFSGNSLHNMCACTPVTHQLSHLLHRVLIYNVLVCCLVGRATIFLVSLKLLACLAYLPQAIANANAALSYSPYPPCPCKHQPTNFQSIFKPYPVTCPSLHYPTLGYHLLALLSICSRLALPAYSQPRFAL